TGPTCVFVCNGSETLGAAKRLVVERKRHGSRLLEVRVVVTVCKRVGDSVEEPIKNSKIAVGNSMGDGVFYQVVAWHIHRVVCSNQFRIRVQRQPSFIPMLQPERGNS